MPGQFFICPGAQKSATTWLHQVLKEHPDFWMPPVKELDYLSDMPTVRKKHIARYGRERPTCHPSIAKWWDLFASDRSLDKYLDITKSDLITGDISPNYIYSPDAAPNARQLVPHAQIIIILRHPVDRAWSHARMVAKEEGRDLSDTDWLMDYATGKWASIMGNYPALINKWTEHFGRAVHLFRYEDIATDPVSQLNDLISIFGARRIDKTFPPLNRQVNVGVPAQIPDRSRLESHHKEAIELYNSVFPTKSDR